MRLDVITGTVKCLRASGKGGSRHLGGNSGDRGLMPTDTRVNNARGSSNFNSLAKLDDFSKVGAFWYQIKYG
jgi:hypothetical protein